MKPRVYVETSVISYLVGSLNQRSLLVSFNQEITREWWSRRRTSHDLYSSIVVVNEAGKGDPVLAAERLAFLSETTRLEVSDAATELAFALLRDAGIPAKADVDALHIAIATVQGM